MSENLEFFRETAERIFADTAGPEQIKAAERGILPADMFAALSENGILTMLAPEEQGGIAASLSEAMTILRVAGDFAAPGPILETILGNGLLGAADRSPGGDPISLIMVPEGLPEGGQNIVLEAPWGNVVDQILLVAPSETGTVLALTRRSAWQIETGVDAAGEPRDMLRNSGPLDMEKIALNLPFDQVMQQASILRGGQMVGAMDWAFRRSVEYSMERQQFGREIGKFQAVQQMLAEMADHLLAATVLLEAASADNTIALVAAARSRLADASDSTITVAHQVHGAIGFSIEYALNYRTRRLMAWRNDYGSVPYWRNRHGSMLINCNRETLWHTLTAKG